MENYKPLSREEALKKGYDLLIRFHHPDQGGDSNKLIEVLSKRSQGDHQYMAKELKEMLQIVEEREKEKKAIEQMKFQKEKIEEIGAKLEKLNKKSEKENSPIEVIKFNSKKSQTAEEFKENLKKDTDSLRDVVASVREQEKSLPNTELSLSDLETISHKKSNKFEKVESQETLIHKTEISQEDGVEAENIPINIESEENKEDSFINYNPQFDVSYPPDIEFIEDYPIEEKVDEDLIKQIKEEEDKLFDQSQIKKDQAEPLKSEWQDEQKEQDKVLQEELQRIANEIALDSIDLDSINDERKKQHSVEKKYNIQESNSSNIEEEYSAIHSKVKQVSERAIEGLKIEEKQLEDEVGVIKQKIGKERARTRMEKMKEYLSSSKKVVEYQIDSLLGETKKLFETMRNLAENRRVQILLGALMIGTAVAVPEAELANLFTGGTVQGLAPEYLIAYAKGVTASIGGVLVSGLVELRQKEREAREGVMTEFDREIKQKRKRIDDGVFASSINYLTFKNPVLRNNFLTKKSRFEQS